jgi:hypothetical protein
VSTVDSVADAIKVVTDKIDTMLEADESDFKFTAAALAETPVGEGGGLDASGIRNAIGLASANLDTQLSGISAVTAKLDDTLEESSGSHRFTEAALAQAPAGEGGGGGADAEEIAEAVAAELGTGAQFTSITDAIGGLNDLSAEDVQSAAEAAIDAKQAGLVEAMWRYIIDPASNTEARCAMAAMLSFSSGDFTTSANTTTFEDATGTRQPLGHDHVPVVLRCSHERRAAEWRTT